MVAQEQSNLPVVFNFGSQSVRTIEQDGEVWFVATDVCHVLDIANPRNASARLDDDEKDAVQITDAIGRQQETTIINESGLYSLILNSRKPEARAFKRWVTHEVLPAIRKTGGYQGAPSGAPADEPLYNTDYRQEARRVAVDYFDRCRDVVQAAGQKNPRFPEMNEMVVSGLLASMLQSGRWLLSFDHTGRMNISAVEPDACVASIAKFAKMIADPGGLMISNAELANLAKACTDKLAQRMERQAESTSVARTKNPA
ncbi:Bro-N domain-containing protein [Pandoraea sp. CB10b_02]|uniref:BRO-N domain-containing protein n=1 Tax=Pandoraea sp. CB10b_02 TaxID=2014535 RepID=UPI00257C34A7|nr:Bro-N domain-containing protein [Pandoraea sp. CB10b_02]